MAFEPLGWRPLAFSEIEAFPRAVLKHHYPDTPCHGDFTTLKDEPWIVDADMLCGGTPCQAFSVAGNRQSLADDRGNLTLQFVLLADAIDHLRSTAGREPAWILWENVPGVLSTSDNAFGAFLGGLCGRSAPIPEPEGGWTRAGVVDGPSRCAAWRTLDAQHFGLAQRRQRVFVLALGGAGRWAAADALLPIIESGCWHPAPSRGKGKGIANDAARSVAIRGREGVPQAELGDDKANTIVTPNGARGGVGVGAVLAPIIMAHGQANAEVVSDGSPSLTCNHEAPIVFARAQVTSVANRINPQPGDPCHTLHRHEPPLLVRMREGKEGGGKGPLVSEDQSLTLATANDQVLCTHEVVGAMCAESGPNTHGSRGVCSTQTMLQGYIQPTQSMQVRRLTPVETSRLQGFPDTHCHIPTGKWRRIPADEAAYLQRHGLHAEQRGDDWFTNVAADGPIYKAHGNSWAVPCARYIGERIKELRP